MADEAKPVAYRVFIPTWDGHPCSPRVQCWGIDQGFGTNSPLHSREECERAIAVHRAMVMQEHFANSGDRSHSDTRSNRADVQAAIDELSAWMRKHVQNGLVDSHIAVAFACLQDALRVDAPRSADVERARRILGDALERPSVRAPRQVYEEALTALVDVHGYVPRSEPAAGPWTTETIIVSDDGRDAPRLWIGTDDQGDVYIGTIRERERCCMHATRLCTSQGGGARQDVRAAVLHLRDVQNGNAEPAAGGDPAWLCACGNRVMGERCTACGRHRGPAPGFTVAPYDYVRGCEVYFRPGTFTSEETWQVYNREHGEPAAGECGEVERLKERCTVLAHHADAHRAGQVAAEAEVARLRAALDAAEKRAAFAEELVGRDAIRGALLADLKGSDSDDPR